MGDTDKIIRDARNLADNAIYDETNATAVVRLCEQWPGVNEWALFRAVLRAWESFDHDARVNYIVEAAATDDAINGPGLFAPADEADPTEADPTEADPPPTSASPPAVTFASVAVGTQVVEHMAGGGSAFTGVVTAVAAECVTVRRTGVVPTGYPETVALRWNEFAVLPKSPEGRGWDGDA